MPKRAELGQLSTRGCKGAVMYRKLYLECKDVSYTTHTNDSLVDMPNMKIIALIASIALIRGMACRVKLSRPLSFC